MRIPVDQWNRADADLPGSYQLSLSLRVSAWYFFQANEAKGAGTGLPERKGNKVTVSKWKHTFYSYRAQWIEGGKPKDKGFKKK